MYPAFRLGYWGNDVEVGVVTGLVLYDTELSEDRAAVTMRLLRPMAAGFRLPGRP